MGGTFDPPHFGHLRLAEEAAEQLALGAVRWIPSGLPGHRGAPSTSPEHRCEMVRIAIAGNPRFTLDDAEIRSTAPTFTVDTLGRLRAELGEKVPLVMIIGMDSFLGLPTWRAWERLFALTHFAVGQRPGYELDEARLAPALRERLAASNAGSLAATPAGAIVRFESTLLDIAASRLRGKLSRGESARYLLPSGVVDYIGTHGLYR
jgi:nicotinate-nucleotide adenylyltransferase